MQPVTIKVFTSSKKRRGKVHLQPWGLAQKGGHCLPEETEKNNKQAVTLLKDEKCLFFFEGFKKSQIYLGYQILPH